MNVLSIQSHVSYGHVGNAAAVFPLQRLGIGVWPVYTVLFSNHTGYDGFRGPVLSPGAVGDVLDGISDRGVLDRCDAVLTGYIGNPDLGSVCAGAVDRVKAANPKALYCCDPVMGDEDGGFYVPDRVADFMRDVAVPRADILTPNKFELRTLSPYDNDDLPGLVAAARALTARGPSLVLVTSLERPDGPDGMIEMLLVGRDAAWVSATPRLAFPIAPNGAGDMTAALFLAHILKGEKPDAALGKAMATVYAVLQRTRDLGQRELAVVEAQACFENPPHSFDVRRL